MDDKDFWGRSPQAGAEPKDPLYPGYRGGEGTITDDLSEAPGMDIDTILEEFREKPPQEEAPDSAQQLPMEDALSEIDLDPLLEFEIPDSGADEVQEMLSVMRELTEEVRQLRARIETRSNTEDANVDVKQPEKPEPAPAAVKRPAAAPAAVKPKKAKQTAKATKEPPKKNKVLSIIGNVLFYVVVVGMVLGAFLMRSASEGQPFMIAGFSAANVLTGSMEDVYPRGSLIITMQVDAKELQIGDDITFMVSGDSSITHRIIGITENYQGTGSRAFQTQGTMNPNPDKDMVAAANVVGKVIFHSKALGDIANFVKQNWPFLIFLVLVLVGLITFLKWNAKKSDTDEEPREEPKEEPKEEPEEQKPRSYTIKQIKNSERRMESNDKQTQNINVHHSRSNGTGAAGGRNLRLDKHQPGGDQRKRRNSQRGRQTPR